MLPLNEFGYFTLASTVAMSLYLLVGPITTAFYPKFCELLARGDEITLIKKFHNGAQLVTIVVGSAGIVLSIFSETFLLLWTQDISLSTKIAPLLSLLTIGHLIASMNWIPYQIQLAYGWTKLANLVFASMILIQLPSLIVLVRLYGVLIVGWIAICIPILYQSIFITFMYKRIITNERLRWLLQDVTIPLLSATFVVMTIKFLCPTPETFESQIGILITAAILSLTASLITCRDIRKYAFDYVKIQFYRRKRHSSIINSIENDNK